MKKINPLITITLILIFAFSNFAPTLAQDNTTISQEKAIEKVKEIFDTSAYEQFNINYNEQGDHKTWDLDWSQSEEPYGNLSVMIDADKGNILNIYMHKGYDPDKKPSLMPKLNEDNALKVAEGFAKKLQPEEFFHAKYNKREEYRPIQPLRYRESYSFNFTRMSQDIPVENDGFNITVNADTGDIESYNFNWSYVPLPSAENLISIKEAERTFKDDVGLKLIYKRYFDHRSKEDTVKLVYTVDEPYRVLIDATNGKVINNNYHDGPMANKEQSMDMVQDGLTPVEQQEVEATKNCITKDTAVSILKKYVDIPKDYIQRYANLYEDYDNPDQKVWNISWEKETDEEHGSIYARVNATSSELLSFNIYEDNSSQGNFKQKYDRKAAQKKAEEFVKQVQSDRFENVKIEEIKEQSKNPEREREHSFSFTRNVNDIPYTANGFNIVIDAASGQVRSYEMRWHEREFPEARGILSKNDAMSQFLENIGLELAYVSIYNPKEKTDKYCLAYKLKPSRSNIFDAFKLEPLDFRGNPIVEKHETVFADIEGHWAERDIQLLVDLGVIKSSENKFKPNEIIAQGEFIKLLMIANNRKLPEDESINTQKYIDTATKIGWIKNGEVEAKSPISREKAATFVVRSLGYEKVASLPDIFNVTVKDRNSISPKYKGHTSIALGLGLMTEDSGSFKPKANISKAEAAAILVRMLKMEK